MAATLFAVVLALVLGHGVPALSRLRQFGWLRAWGEWLHTQLHDGPLGAGAWALLPLLGLPLAAVVLVQTGLAGGWPVGVLGLAFAVAVLFYSWGPHDLDLDVAGIVEAETSAERQQAAAVLWPHDRPPSLNGPDLVEAVFRGALRRWFGVLLWFLLLGPAGALLYRLTALLAEDSLAAGLPAATRTAAADLLRILDWPAAHLMTLGLALVANFDSVYAAWRASHADGLKLDLGFLGAAARACVASELAAEAETEGGSEPATLPALSELRDAMSLAWRILLLWLAVLALFVLAGWVN